MKNVFVIALAALTLGCGKSVDKSEPIVSSKPEIVTPGDTTATSVASTKIQEVKIQLPDGKFVFGTFSPCEGGKDAPIVLMFHQAGSNRGEYESISKRMVTEGYNCIAIDQRSGGTMWGRDNATAKQYSGNQSYENAYQDMLATFQWAKKEGYAKILLWGSSYSASLVLRLGAEQKGIAEIICASPGEYFSDKGIVKGWAAKQTATPFFICPKSESNDLSAIFDVIPIEEKSFLEQDPGIHGSRAFIASTNPKSEEAWKALLDFLGTLPEQESQPESEQP